MPNRILKESICTSDSIDSLSWFEECLYYRLIVNCDDFGRFDGRTAVIKNRLFPLKENLTLKAVSEAIKNSLIGAVEHTYVNSLLIEMETTLWYNGICINMQKKQQKVTRNSRNFIKIH